MWAMMLISYFVVSYIDTKAFTRLNEKGMLPFYIILMAASCIIGTAFRYVKYMPSPADPIKDIVLFLIGK